MYLGSEYYDGTTQTCWFEPYIRNLSLTLPHGRNYYEVWPFLVYMSYNPDNLSGLGIDSVKRLISEAQPGDVLWTSGHVGICTSAGGGSYIHAPQPGQTVCESSWPQFVCALRW